MREIHIPLTEIGLIAGTRAALGVGIGLLLADRFSHEQRQAAGWALVTIGVLTTFPLVADVLSRRGSHGSVPSSDERAWPPSYAAG